MEMEKITFNAKRFILTLIALGIATAVVGYVLMAKSDAYYAAEKYLKNNHPLVEAIGSIQNARLGLKYDSRPKGGVAITSLKVVLSGQKRSADAYLTLQEGDGIWKIKSGNLILDNDNSIPLTPE